MSILTCVRCGVMTNTKSDCPVCGTATVLNEPLEAEMAAEQLAAAQPEVLARLAAEERCRFGSLSHDALRYITNDLTNAIEWCGESREATEIRELLTKALGLVDALERKRAV